MACSSCAAKNQAMTFAKATLKSKSLGLAGNQEQHCKYSFEQITETLESFPKEGKKLHKIYLQNALKNYSKNCNLFVKQLDKIFK